MKEDYKFFKHNVSFKTNKEKQNLPNEKSYTRQPVLLPKGKYSIKRIKK